MERAYDPLETALEERQLLKARSHQAVTPLLTKVESCKSAEVPLSTALSKDGCNDKGVGGEQEAEWPSECGAISRKLVCFVSNRCCFLLSINAYQNIHLPWFFFMFVSATYVTLVNPTFSWKMLCFLWCWKWGLSLDLNCYFNYSSRVFFFFFF